MNNTYWVLVSTGPGSFFKATTQAPNPWIAYQMFKGMYGDKLLSESAAPVVEPYSYS